MKASLTSKIREFLNRNGPATTRTVAEAIAELSTTGGEQRALLLMRLDPQLEPAKEGLWRVRGILENEDDKVRKVADEYFQSLKRPGAPISTTIKYICEQTFIDPPKVKESLEKYYVTKGPNIFNRLKGEEDN